MINWGEVALAIDASGNLTFVTDTWRKFRDRWLKYRRPSSDCGPFYARARLGSSWLGLGCDSASHVSEMRVFI